MQSIRLPLPKSMCIKIDVYIDCNLNMLLMLMSFSMIILFLVPNRIWKGEDRNKSVAPNVSDVKLILYINLFSYIYLYFSFRLFGFFISKIILFQFASYKKIHFNNNLFNFRLNKIQQKLCFYYGFRSQKDWMNDK